MENFSFLWENLQYIAEHPKMLVMWIIGGLLIFLANLKYMGIGMLGIFIVMGVIIGSVYLLNNAFKPRKKKNEGDE